MESLEGSKFSVLAGACAEDRVKILVCGGAGAADDEFEGSKGEGSKVRMLVEVLVVDVSPNVHQDSVVLGSF